MHRVTRGRGPVRSVAVPLPADLDAFLQAEQRRTGRSAAAILRMALIARRNAFARYEHNLAALATIEGDLL